MRYSRKAQELANECARKEFEYFGCLSALYDGKLDEFPDTLIFSPLFQEEAPALGMPPFILVRNNETDLILDMGILHALMEKYEWPEEFSREDGWTPPTQIKRYYQVKDEAERITRTWHEEHHLPCFAPMKWEVEKRILRECFHIQWKSPDEIFLQRIYT